MEGGTLLETGTSGVACKVVSREWQRASPNERNIAKLGARLNGERWRTEAERLLRAPCSESGRDDFYSLGASFRPQTGVGTSPKKADSRETSEFGSSWMILRKEIFDSTSSSRSRPTLVNRKPLAPPIVTTRSFTRAVLIDWV